MHRAIAILLCLVSVAAFSSDDNSRPLNGTWQTDPDVVLSVSLSNGGVFDCAFGPRHFRIRANGRDYPTPGTGFTTVRVTQIDDRTVSFLGKLGPDPFVDIQMTASANGETLLFRQRTTLPHAQPVEDSMTLTRVSSGPPESHAISGRWSEPIEVDFTSFEILGDTLVRKNSQGTSYSAKLDGTEAPYVGRPGVSVSVKLVDDHTLEQIDKQDGKVFLVERFKVDPDSRVIRARYEDPRGHVITETAHRIEAPASLEAPSATPPTQ